MKTDGSLRRQPRDNAPSLGMLKEGSAVAARAYRGQLAAGRGPEDGRSGWVQPSLVSAR